MGYGRGALGAFALCVASTLAIALRAQPTRAEALDLRWRAPARCPGAAEVEQKLRALISVEELTRAELHVSAHVLQRGGEYQLSLRIDTGKHRAERSLHAASCAQLADTAAWLIALTLDPELGTRGAAPERAAPEVRKPSAQETAAGAAPAASQAGAAQASASRSEASPPAAQPSARTSKAGSAAATPARPEQSPAPARPPRITTPRAPWTHNFRSGGSAGVAYGSAAGAQAAFGMYLGYAAGPLYTEARIAATWPRALDIAPGASLELWSLDSALSECGLFGDTLRLGPCLGLSLERSAAQPNGLAMGRDQAYLWGRAGAGLKLFWKLREHMELTSGLAANIPITPRPRYVIEGGPVAVTKPWSLDAWIGLGFALR